MTGSRPPATSEHNEVWAYLMAATVVMILPIIMLFFTKRTLIEGISLTGIKG